jgi:PBP1b-binding outer membrane lipoprotein LpoB
MKSFSTIALLFATLFTFGCATSETAPNAAAEEAPAVGESAEGDAATSAKTAYEGSTGSGLLMERYKSGEISGFRD